MEENGKNQDELQILERAVGALIQAYTGNRDTTECEKTVAVRLEILAEQRWPSAMSARQGCWNWQNPV